MYSNDFYEDYATKRDETFNKVFTVNTGLDIACNFSYFTPTNRI